MSRLQDFPSVTPTASDNILIVQSDGQGLASVGSTLGAKMDKANPTGTGSLSLNRASGSTVGTQSTTLGRNCIASGTRSFATGQATSATGNDGSFAEGYSTVASGGYGSHAEGRGTTASGESSHAEGNGSIASGHESHAEGNGTEASGVRSHTEGRATIANHRSQHVFGEFNLADTSTATSDSRGTYVEIVGNGPNASNRANARTLDWNGNETLAGDLTIKGNKSMETVANAVYSYRFNSSTPVVLDAFDYASFIIMGYAQGVGAIAVLLIVQNGTIRYTKNMINGSDFSSTEISFTYSNAQLTIASTKAAYSTLTIIKGCP